MFANHSNDKARFSHQREQAEGSGRVVIAESEGLSVCGAAGMHSLTLSLLFLSVSPLFSHCFPKHLFNRILTTSHQYITLKNGAGRAQRKQPLFLLHLQQHFWLEEYPAGDLGICILLDKGHFFFSRFNQLSAYVYHVSGCSSKFSFIYICSFNPVNLTFTLSPGSFQMPTKFITTHGEVDINWFQVLKQISTIKKKIQQVRNDLKDVN